MSTTNSVNPLAVIAAAPLTTPRSNSSGSSGSSSSSFFEAMARAWGEALNKQADVITQQSDAISNAGNDTPAAITELTAQSLKMSFLTNSSHSSISAVGEALSTMSRKQ
jgi:hypothetical protein